MFKPLTPSGAERPSPAFVAVLVQYFPGLLEVAGLPRTKSFLLNRAVHALDFSVGLRVVSARKNLLDLELLQKSFKIVTDKLRSIVIDEARPRMRVLFFHALNEHFNRTTLHIRH